MAYDLMKGRQDGKDWSLGASITTTTDDVEDRLRSLTTDTNNLNADVTAWYKNHAGESGAQKFASAWSEWRDATYKFIKSWKEGPFYKIKLAWNYVDNAEERMRELAEWRRRWEQLSGEKSTAPSTPPPAPPKPKNPDGRGGAWKILAILGAGGLGAMLIAKKLGG